MATLSQTAQQTRKVLAFSAIAILVLIIGKLTWDIGLEIYRKNNPPPVPPPEVAFGKLPTPDIGSGLIPEVPFRYRLDTADGRYPDATPSAYVFLASNPMAGLLAKERARAQAKEWKFTGEPEVVSTAQYRWRSDDGIREITIDGRQGNFSYTYDVNQDASVIEGVALPTTEEAREIVFSILSRRTIFGERERPLWREDFDLEKSTAAYVRYDGARWIETRVPSQADAIRVTVARKEVFGLPVRPADPMRTFVALVVSGFRDERKVLDVTYRYTVLNDADATTYPIKSSPEAWRELEGGRAVIMQLPQRRIDRVNITAMSLAYVLHGDPSDYVQPFWVFEGDEFIAYLPAVTDEWLLP